MTTERVEPTPFDAAVPSNTAAGNAARVEQPGGGQRWVVPGLITLVVLALVVVFWLPGRVDQSGAPSAGPTTVAANNNSGASATDASQAAQQGAPAASPFADAAAARSREAAQEILSELLDVREQLELRGAQSWAGEELAALNATATAGDELYRERAFEQAIARYEDALAQGIALEGRIPAQLRTQLDNALAALAAGDADGASAALALAEQLEPGLGETQTLRDRLEALPAVLAQLTMAAEAESVGDLAGARAALEKAVKADPAHRRSAEELARVAAALLQKNFSVAMSDGYGALDSGSFKRARKAFAKAEALMPGSTEAQAALQEVQAAETARKLQDLREEAQQQVDAEQWRAALASFEAALAIDGSLLFAQKGAQLAGPRAQLAEQMQETLDNPKRLADEKVADAAEGMLRYAQGIQPRGPLLARQLDALEDLLQKARTPVSLTLLSDGETEVTVLKVVRLGQFARRELTLRPGDYVAVGTRRGFRDVRKTFTVNYGETPQPVTVACTENI